MPMKSQKAETLMAKLGAALLFVGVEKAGRHSEIKCNGVNF